MNVQLEAENKGDRRRRRRRPTLALACAPLHRYDRSHPSARSRMSIRRAVRCAVKQKLEQYSSKLREQLDYINGSLKATTDVRVTLQTHTQVVRSSLAPLRAMPHTERPSRASLGTGTCDDRGLFIEHQFGCKAFGTRPRAWP